MSAKVWVLGDAVVDLLPESDGRLLPCPGGAPANVAVGIARLGGTSGFIGRVRQTRFVEESRAHQEKHWFQIARYHEVTCNSVWLPDKD